MIKRDDLANVFVDDFGWKPVKGLVGDFSVSPDPGPWLRVFSSDIKIRRNGRMLLGVIGLYTPQCCYEFPSKLGLSAYITNLEQFASPPMLQSKGDLHNWAKQIAECVVSLPPTISEFKNGLEAGRVGPFEARLFLESTPRGERFVECVSTLR